MAAITYTAKRKLMAGHSANVDYSFDIGLTRRDITTNAKRTESISISGKSEVWLQRIEYKWNITFIDVDESAGGMDQIREFISSVYDGTEFLIDFEGTVAVPVSPIAVKMESDRVTESRSAVTYVGASFVVREVV